MKVIYVAGPYRGPNAWAIEQNIRRAEVAALGLWRLGFAVICPHTNTRFFQGAAPDHVWLDGDLEFVRRSDALFLVEGWQNSSGALAEIELAKSLSLPIFRTYTEATNWAHSKSGDAS